MIRVYKETFKARATSYYYYYYYYYYCKADSQVYKRV
jgi:hypothetical protein